MTPPGRKPRGDQPITVVASTKVTEDERDRLKERYGTVYAGVRHGIELALEEEDQ